MSTKKKGAEEQLIERNRDLDRLKARIEELEKQLAVYKAKDSEITSAITLAAQSRANIIAEAEKISLSMTHNAEKKAQSIIDDANLKAGCIIADAQKEAARIIGEAKTEADELTKATEKTTKEIVGIAFENSKKVNDHTQAINETLIRSATELYRYITAFRDDYEQVTGKRIEGIADLEKEKKPARTKPAKKEAKTPDDYKTPEELYHTVLKLSGRDPESKIPESVPLSSDMLDIGNPDDNISEIVNVGSTNEPAEPEQIKEEQAEQTVADDAKEEKSDRDDLEAMLSSFMSNIDKKPEQEEQPVEESNKDNDEDNLDNILGAITEESTEETPLSPDTDELTRILNELFGEEKKSNAQ